MKLIFLSANEKLDSGLLQSQLVKPVETVFGSAAALINIHRPFANRFKSSCLKVLNLPLLVPFRFVNFRPVFFCNELICLLYAIVIALWLFSIGREYVLVTRGYVPGLVGWWLNRLFRIRFIFDPRSLYVHEHIGAGSIRERSLIQRYWLWVERRLVHQAAGIVCVSEGMADYYCRLGVSDSSKMIIIPCFSVYNMIPTGFNRSLLRNKLGFADNDLVIAYFGSLNAGWNNLSMYYDFFESVGRTGAKILIISQDADSLRKTDLSQMPHVKIVGGSALHDQDESALMLHAADFGVVLMRDVPDWKTRLSVKFAEYTCHGLPVIVSRYVGEAARLVHAFSLVPSIVIEGKATDLRLRKATQEESEWIRTWATRYFDQRNILRLLDILQPDKPMN